MIELEEMAEALLLRLEVFEVVAVDGQLVLDPLDDASLPFCAPDYAAVPPTSQPLLDAEARLRSFVARLFPVAQGVYE